jgi:hypothetical protein
MRRMKIVSGVRMETSRVKGCPDQTQKESAIRSAPVGRAMLPSIGVNVIDSKPVRFNALAATPWIAERGGKRARAQSSGNRDSKGT